MQIVILGPPGSGKGTQASLISKKFDIPHVSTGDILRGADLQNKPLGAKAKEYMDTGELVPDEMVVGIVGERLKGEDCNKGFILDGFPRNLKQAEFLESSLDKMGKHLEWVINICVSEAELVKRLTGRRSCQSCGQVFHLLFDPPEEESICDECGGNLYQREDDSVETVTRRLRVYLDQTAPLIDYYKEKDLLRSIDGGQPAELVFKDIITALKGDYA